MKHSGVTVELVPMPVEFKAAENLVEEDVVIAVSARRESSVEDLELETELKEGLEGFDASLGQGHHVAMPSSGDRTPTASQHEMNRIASAQAMFGRPWELESEDVRDCTTRFRRFLTVASLFLSHPGPRTLALRQGTRLAVGVGHCEEQRRSASGAIHFPAAEEICCNRQTRQAARVDLRLR
jgi:hypothetical protein